VERQAVKIADAAVALAGACGALLTNDRTLLRVTELAVLVLDDLEL
jgi:hypothetical protein